MGQQNSPIRIYVSPKGNDQNPGTKDKPLATLTGARNAVRSYKSDHTVSDTLSIIIQSGTYQMKTPLVLGPQDGGSEQFPVIYQAASGAHPVFSGGKQITGFNVDRQGIWHAQIPEVQYYGWRFDQLYVNGKRAQIAHSPNKGFYHIQKIKEKVWVQGSGRSPEKARQTITVSSKAFSELNTLDAVSMKNIRFRAYHKWDFTMKHIEATNPDSLSFTTLGGGMKPWNPMQKNTRIRFENYPAALDSAGEWYLSRDGELSYIPRPGETMENSEVIAPALPYFIKINGQPKNGVYAEHIQFKGLTFTYSRYNIGPGGFEPNQAATVVPAAIQLTGARDVKFKQIEVKHTGQHGIWFGKGSQNDQVEHCYLHDLGGGGVYIGTTQLVPDQQLAQQISVENSILQSGGWEFPPAVGVWIGHSAHNRITHNDIGDFRYTGVSVGWHWGYEESPAEDNKILYNHIHHIGWGLLSDMGGVYTLGPQPGTEVNHNVIHDIYSFSYGGWGLYPDEGSSNIVMEDNLVYHTKNGGFHQHYGEKNIIRNNIFAFASQNQLQCTRVEDHLSFTFDHNIIVYNRGVLLAGPWDKVRIQMDHNLYWHYGGEQVRFLKKSFSDWQQLGRDTRSIIASPGFKDPQHLDFTFVNHKTISKISFTPFDYSKAGIYGSKSWIDKAKLSDTKLEKFDELFSEK